MDASAPAATAPPVPVTPVPARRPLLRDDRRTPLEVLAELGAAAPGQLGTENFPVALRLLPSGPRDLLERVYGYARFVDDVGDEAPGDRLALLDLVEADVRALWGGSPRLGPVRALRPVVERCGLPIRPLLDLIEANRVDQTTSGYETFEDLLAYCRLSAAPVGLVVLHVAGRVDAADVTASDAVCSALQVLEHCQDVGEDAARGRVYLPRADLRAAGVPDGDLTSTATSPALRDVVALQVSRSRELLAEGDDLVRRLRGWSRLAVSGYVAGGLATADALRDADFEVLAGPVGPTRARTARHALRLLAGRRSPGLPRRRVPRPAGSRGA